MPPGWRTLLQPAPARQRARSPRPTELTPHPAAPPASSQHYGQVTGHEGDNDCTDGYGEWHYQGSPSAPLGEIYSGPWKNGQRDTTGRMSATGRQEFVMEDDEDHSYYEGGWEADKRHGMGTFVDKQGTWKGTWIAGEKGEGEFTARKTEL